MFSTSNAPTRVHSTLGTPNMTSIRLSSPCLKKLILPIFPKMCKKATRTRAVLKSKINKLRGSAMVEEPKPAIVPMISEMKAMGKNNKSITSL